MDFRGKTILYTGAAGGLGLTTSLAFLGAGATVVAIDKDSAKVAVLETAGQGAGGRLVVERLDLADLGTLRVELDRVASWVGGFDIVINNAAIYPAKPFGDFTIEEHQRVQRVNVDAGIVCMQAALPDMRRKGWGRVVNIASVTFYGGWAQLSPYVASKGALIGLTRAWAREFGPDGITVNAVAPGAFPTDAEKIHPDPEGYARFVLERQALKRRGSPQDIANILMFLASDMSSFITGQTINVDGGWIMH
jgi:NAD(P)-dependent dehydrogenase (short-subunit alcohol dehydrogenase family)